MQETKALLLYIPWIYIYIYTYAYARISSCVYVCKHIFIYIFENATYNIHGAAYISNCTYNHLSLSLQI